MHKERDDLRLALLLLDRGMRMNRVVLVLYSNVEVCWLYENLWLVRYITRDITFLN